MGLKSSSSGRGWRINLQERKESGEELADIKDTQENRGK